MAVSKKRKTKKVKCNESLYTNNIVNNIDLRNFDEVVIDSVNFNSMSNRVMGSYLGDREVNDFSAEDFIDFVKANGHLIGKPSLRYFNMVTEEHLSPRTNEPIKIGVVFTPVKSHSKNAVVECNYYANKGNVVRVMFSSIMYFNPDTNNIYFSDMRRYISAGFIRDLKGEDFLLIYVMVQVFLMNNIITEVDEKYYSEDAIGSSSLKGSSLAVEYRSRSTATRNVVNVNKRRVYRLDKKKVAKKLSNITCPVWGVRGHWRVYKKTGKRVWIEPYKKGKDRNNSEKYVSKTYKID